MNRCHIGNLERAPPMWVARTSILHEGPLGVGPGAPPSPAPDEPDEPDDDEDKRWISPAGTPAGALKKTRFESCTLPAAASASCSAGLSARPSSSGAAPIGGPVCCRTCASSCANNCCPAALCGTYFPAPKTMCW